MKHARAAFVATLLSAHAALRAAADATVELRGNAGTLVSSTATATLRGLELRGVRRDEGAAAREETVPWDMVRSVEGGAAAGAGADLATMLEAGTALWRARARIERGDCELARPLLRDQWARFAKADGPTAALVAEGMLRCAVSAGDMGASVEPWLECLRHRGAKEPLRFAALAPVLDPETALLPSLPPFVPSDRRADLLSVFEAIPSAADASAPAAAREVGGRLARLMRRASGAVPEPAAPPRADAEPAVKVLALLDGVASAADARALTRALDEFDRAYPEPPAFVASWRLAAAACAQARHARAVQGDGRIAALERAALEMLAVPASALDQTGLVDAYALEEAEALVREAGLRESADRIAALRGATTDRTKARP